MSYPRCDEFKKKYGSWKESPTRIIILDLLKLLKKNGYSAKGMKDQVRADFNMYTCVATNRNFDFILNE